MSSRSRYACAMDEVAKPARVYGGATAQERAEERRRRLLDTALELYGGDGPAASIERLCASAKVSTSHFYKLYRSRDELLADLYDRLTDELFARMATAVAAVPFRHADVVRAGVGAYADFVSRDDATARMLLIVPHAGADAMLPHRRAAVDRTVDLLDGLARGLVAAGELPDRDYRLTAIALAGAGIELFSSWFLADPRPPLDAVREELVRVHLATVG